MAVKLIGLVEYQINNPPEEGGGSFYLTEELLGKIQMLQLESEETIDRLVRTELLGCGDSSSSQTAKQHSGSEESTGGQYRRSRLSVP